MRHVILSLVGGGSGDDAADLEVDDRVLIEADPGQDAVAVLVELRARPGTAGSSSNWTGAATKRNGVPEAVWHSCTYPLATV